jgi:hypothetical protein
VDRPSREKLEGPTDDRRGERPILQPDEWHITNRPGRIRYRENMGPDYNRCPKGAPK